MGCIVKFLVTVFAMLISSVAYSATYHVTTNGSSSNSGTSGSPWSLSYAAQQASAGDTVLIHGGTYNSVLQPANNGTASNPIVFRNYNGETALIRGASAYDNPIFINRDHIVIDGLSVKKGFEYNGYMANINIDGFGTNNVTIRNCRIIDTAGNLRNRANAGQAQRGIWVNKATDVLIENCEISGMTLVGIHLDNSRRVIIRNNNIHENFFDAVRFNTSYGNNQQTLVENNQLWGSQVSDGIQFGPNYDLDSTAEMADTSNCGVYIRNNDIYNNAENGVDLKGTCSIIVEGNRIYGNTGNNDGQRYVNSCTGQLDDRCGGLGGIMHGSFTSSRDVILRKNLIYDNMGGIYIQDASWVSYNNTIINNYRDFTGPNSSFYYNARSYFTGIQFRGRNTNNLVKNNLIGENLREIEIMGAAQGEMDGNIYFSRYGSPSFSTQVSPIENLNFNEYRSRLSGYNIIGGEANSRVISDPRFVNVPVRPIMGMNLDFSLQSNSEAVDAGVALTRASSSGSGLELTVDNARVFTDGLGAVPGDLIRVGSQVARVVGVNYSANRLTLDRSISWSNNAAVNLDFSGNAPDVGAVESGSSSNNPPANDPPANDPPASGETFLVDQTGTPSINASSEQNAILHLDAWGNYVVNFTGGSGSTTYTGYISSSRPLVRKGLGGFESSDSADYAENNYRINYSVSVTAGENKYMLFSTRDNGVSDSEFHLTSHSPGKLLIGGGKVAAEVMPVDLCNVDECEQLRAAEEEPPANDPPASGETFLVDQTGTPSIDASSEQNAILYLDDWGNYKVHFTGGSGSTTYTGYISSSRPLVRKGLGGFESSDSADYAENNYRINYSVSVTAGENKYMLFSTRDNGVSDSEFHLTSHSPGKLLIGGGKVAAEVMPVDLCNVDECEQLRAAQEPPANDPPASGGDNSTDLVGEPTIASTQQNMFFYRDEWGNYGLRFTGGTASTTYTGYIVSDRQLVRKSLTGFESGDLADYANGNYQISFSVSVDAGDNKRIIFSASDYGASNSSLYVTSHSPAKLKLGPTQTSAASIPVNFCESGACVEQEGDTTPPEPEPQGPTSADNPQDLTGTPSYQAWVEQNVFMFLNQWGTYEVRLTSGTGSITYSGYIVSDEPFSASSSGFESADSFTLSNGNRRLDFTVVMTSAEHKRFYLTPGGNASVTEFHLESHAPSKVLLGGSKAPAVAMPVMMD